MAAGRILCAQHEGAFALKFEGDVRLNYCTALDEFIAAMFATPSFVSVFVDLSQAAGLDSTTLGMIAKLAVEAQAKGYPAPTIFSPKADITRLLDSMGFTEVFDIQAESLEAAAQLPADKLEEMALPDCNEAEVQAKVIEAHKVLAGLSAENKLKFRELLLALGSDIND